MFNVTILFGFIGRTRNQNESDMFFTELANKMFAAAAKMSDNFIVSRAERDANLRVGMTNVEIELYGMVHPGTRTIDKINTIANTFAKVPVGMTFYAGEVMRKVEAAPPTYEFNPTESPKPDPVAPTPQIGPDGAEGGEAGTVTLKAKLEGGVYDNIEAEWKEEDK